MVMVEKLVFYFSTSDYSPYQTNLQCMASQPQIISPQSIWDQPQIQS